MEDDVDNLGWEFIIQRETDHIFTLHNGWKIYGVPMARHGQDMYDDVPSVTDILVHPKDMVDGEPYTPIWDTKSWAVEQALRKYKATQQTNS